jgi:hypothetical protein
VCTYSCVPVDPRNPIRYLAPRRDPAIDDEPTADAQQSSTFETQRDEDENGLEHMSETMKGGFNWLVESSDEEETEAEFRRQLARVEADEVKPPPTVTKQYLDVSRRRTLPRGTSTSGLATTDGSSNVSTVHLSLASSSAGTAEISVGRGNVQDGDSAIPQARTGALESPVLALPPPRAKRRWQRADNQLQSYFTSLMASDQLAEPNLRVRRNISSREHRYKERIRRTSTTADKRAGEHAGVAAARNGEQITAAAIASTTTFASTSSGVQIDELARQPPRRMLAFDNITRRVQQAMQGAKSLEQQRLCGVESR